MQKTWRASDFVVVLILLVLAFMAYMQWLQADRTHEALVSLTKTVESLASRPAASPPVAPTPTPSGGNGSSATDGPKPLLAAAPERTYDPSRRGDWLIYHFGSEPRTLNAITSKDAYASIVQSFLLSSMIDRNPDTLEWYGRMAESAQISDDKLTITFKLRPALVWSDGKPITADDVVFSFQTMMDPKVDARQAANYYKDVEKVTAVDERTVQFKFRQPYFMSFEVAGTLTIIPRHVYAYKDAEEFNRRRFDGKESTDGFKDVVVSSGPYVFESWTPGREIVLKRNDRYFGQPGYFEKVCFRIVADETASMQMLKARELDRMSLPAEQFLIAQKDAAIAEAYKLLKYSSPGSGYSYIAWNNKHPVFKDRRVRMAMTHLVPRERILKLVYKDLAQIVTGPFWPGGSAEIKVALQYDKTIQPWPFHPAKALALLAEAGWRDTNGDGTLDKDGTAFKFQLLIPSGRQSTIDMASVVKEEMGKVGIGMEVMQLEWSVFTDRLDKRSYDAISLGWTGGIEGDPYQIWHSSQIADQGSNHVQFSNPEVDRLLEQARVELDVTKRNELYHRFHRILHEEQPYTFLMHPLALIAVHGRFEGVQVHILGLDVEDWWTPATKRIYR